MSKFNLFAYAETLVQSLKPIEHKKLLRAFGVEELLDFQAKISQISKRCLIAVNGYDAEASQADSDSKLMLPQYAIIVVQPCTTTDENTIFKAAEECRVVTEEIYKKMLIDVKTNDTALRNKPLSNVKFAGIGPIGDNFYGSVVYFSLKENYNFQLTKELWEPSEA